MDTVINAAGKKLFSRHMEHYTPTDPLYETYTDDRGRQKRRKRALPPGLSDRDMKILRSVNKRAHYLDKGFNICGLRFGWTFIIGMIPAAGDIADASLGYFLVIRKARKADVPPWLIQRMLLNLAIATVVGVVPIVGDVMLAAWRANSRNAALLEEYLRQRGEGNTKESAQTKAIAPASKGKDKQISPNNAPNETAEAGPSNLEAPARSPSGNSRRSWMWRRSSKDKSIPQIQKRDSRFVEEIGSSPPKTPKSS
ncbi:hypothetical protein OF83DRAFT_1126700 [Amylostereum chailletii]|nr:hypothetical protein OF83DRAFT_1126700 [Amylostereum chailletii]